VALGSLATVGRGGGSESGYGGIGGRLRGRPGIEVGVVVGGVAVCGQVVQPIDNEARRCSVDKETIRRVIRRHLNEVRYCYEKALQAAGPEIEGRVMVRFTIGGGGGVITSEVEESTLGAPEVEACIAHAARRWVFPVPRGAGLVEVRYPFRLHLATGAR
jgi:TonB family protein